MSPADPVPRFFSFLLGVHGRDARHRALGQPDPARGVLGADEPHLVHADRLLVPPRRRAPRRAHGAGRDRRPAASACCSACWCSGAIVGSYDLDAVLAAGDAIRAHALVPARARAGRSLGALTKSAQFPFHFWLPHAMAAPTPVSAYLHSATMVKAGVFLLARLWPALAGTELWFWMVSRRGRGLAAARRLRRRLFQRDMKGVLAYSTISHLGLITLLLGMNSAARAGRGGLPHDEPRDVQGVAVHGGRHRRPRDRHARPPPAERAAPRSCRSPATLATVAARGDGGRAAAERLPLQGDVLRGDRSSAGSATGLRITLPVVATLAGIFSVAYSLRFVHQVFFGPPSADLPRAAARADALACCVPSALLVLACLLVGIFPAPDDRPARSRWPCTRSSATTCRPTPRRCGTAYAAARDEPHRARRRHGLLHAASYTRGAGDGGARRCSRASNARRAFDIINVSLIRGAGALTRRLCPPAPAGRSCS